MSLDILIAEHFKRDIHSTGDADFFVAAVKVAHISGPETRSKVTADIAEALNCDIASLMFLFGNSAANNNSAQTEFPCFRDAILPEAAE